MNGDELEVLNVLSKRRSNALKVPSSRSISGGTTRVLATTFCLALVLSGVDGTEVYTKDATAQHSKHLQVPCKSSSPLSAGNDYDFKGCAMASQNPAFAEAIRHGGRPQPTSLPFCGSSIDYPISVDISSEEQLQEDSNMRELHEKMFRVIEESISTDNPSGLPEGASLIEECGLALKGELCRTAFSICDVDAGPSYRVIEYCPHSHLPATEPVFLQVAVCSRTRAENIGIKTAGDMGSRAVCAGHWGGVSCFRLPSACEDAGVLDTPPGTCSSDSKMWRGMPSGCFSLDAEDVNVYIKHLPKGIGGDAKLKTTKSVGAKETNTTSPCLNSSLTPSTVLNELNAGLDRPAFAQQTAVAIGKVLAPDNTSGYFESKKGGWLWAVSVILLCSAVALVVCTTRCTEYKVAWRSGCGEYTPADTIEKDLKVVPVMTRGSTLPSLPKRTTTSEV